MNRMLLSLVLIISSASALAQSATPSAGKAPKDATTQPTMEDEVAKTRTEMAEDDTDKDGKISEKEFLVRHSDAFRKMDLNRDGSLTPEEFVTYRRQLIEANRRRMENMQRSMTSPQQ